MNNFVDSLKRSSARIALFMCCAVVATRVAGAEDDHDLPARLKTYFLEPDSKTRAKLAKEIAPSATAPQVAAAMQTMNLWEPIAEQGEFEVQAGERSLRASYRAPRYDPTKKNPAAVTFASTENLKIPKETEDFIFIRPQTLISFDYGTSLRDAPLIRTLFREIRRRFHVDEDRVHLIEYSHGSPAGWLTKIWHWPEFASSLLQMSIPTIPYPREFWPLLADNVANGSPPPDPDTRHAVEGPESACAVDPKGNPQFPFELCVFQLFWSRGAIFDPSSASLDAKVHMNPRAVFHPDLSRTGDELYGFSFILPRANPIPREIRHYFRSPDQADLGWIRVLAMRDGPWTADQFSVVTAPGVDRDDFITAALKEKLGYVHAKIDGQTIDIQTRNCERVELRLMAELLDLEKPVTITVNGRKRSEAIIRPSIETMLECAYEDWRFAHPIVARIPLGIQKDTEE